MKTIRRAEDRGHANHGWLDSHHTFSFADYNDPKHMGFRALRVINEDRVAPGQGFGTHGHRDMEIISYPLSGALSHKDSTGTGSVIRYGDVQRMSAGTGVMHSEQNASRDEPVHFLQIWIVPDKRGLAPSYEERNFPLAERDGKLRLIAGKPGASGAGGNGAEAGALTIHADARIFSGVFRKGQSATAKLAEGRSAWVHVARGQVDVAGERLGPGDAVAISGEREISFDGVDEGEVLLFDLA